ncbi:MAG TPA: arginase [Chlamydiales bacterium]|nr:arginase [Chlamydiales bacterium]
MRREYSIIGACTCWGAQIRTCEKGPEVLIQSQTFEQMKKEGALIREISVLYPEEMAAEIDIPLPQSLPLIHNFDVRLAQEVQKVVKQGLFPIVLGGDHSIAVGTWNGFEGPFGLLWIDAHLDAHTEKTTPSGAYHGMPVASLLGRGLPEMAHLLKKEPILLPENLAYIGARSFEEGELALLKKLNVKIYYMDEVKKRGLKAILPEAIAYVTRNTSRYGISLDLDVFSPEEAPGVGSPEKGGISKKEFLPLLQEIGEDPRLIGFELVEFNPERDQKRKTEKLAFEILQKVMR